jgi:hypothetical protein
MWCRLRWRGVDRREDNPKIQIRSGLGQAPEYGARLVDSALNSDDPRPSFDTCSSLAREFQNFANRCHNAELYRRAESEGAEPPIEQLRDDFAEWERRKYRKFKVAADRLCFEAEELEGYFGGYQWEDDDGVISLREIQDILSRIGAVPQAIRPADKGGRFQEVFNVRGKKIVARDIGRTPGRPIEAWHAAARVMARAIKNAMLESGYRGSLSEKNSKSVTAKVGAAAVNWFFKNAVEISPAGFAAASKERDRRKGKRQLTFEECFPEAARIEVEE